MWPFRKKVNECRLCGVWVWAPGLICFDCNASRVMAEEAVVAPPPSIADARRLQEECDAADKWMRAELRRRIEAVQDVWPERFAVWTDASPDVTEDSYRLVRNKTEWRLFKGNKEDDSRGKALFTEGDLCGWTEWGGRILRLLLHNWSDIERRVAEQAAFTHKEKMAQIDPLLTDDRPIEQRRRDAMAEFMEKAAPNENK